MDVEVKPVGSVTVGGLVAGVAALVDEVDVLAVIADEVGADGRDGAVGEGDV
jgi:hypothetical protein